MSKHRQYTPHDLRDMGWHGDFTAWRSGGRDFLHVHIWEDGTNGYEGTTRRNPKDPYDFGLAVKVALGRAVKEARKAGALE